MLGLSGNVLITMCVRMMRMKMRMVMISFVSIINAKSSCPALWEKFGCLGIPGAQFLWFWEPDNGHLLENCNTRDRISRWLSPLLIVRVVVQIIILAVFWKAKGLFQKVSWVNNNAKKIHGKVVATRDWQWSFITKRGSLAKTCPKKFQRFWPKLNQSYENKKRHKTTETESKVLSELFLRHSSSWLMRRLAGKCRATCCKSSKAMPSSRCFVF